MSNVLDGKTLYIFIDESGNFDFTSRGTKFFALTAISTTNPLFARECFLKLRYELLNDGIDQPYFHATEDRQSIRNRFFENIKMMKDIEINSIIAQKNEVDPFLHLEEKFYQAISQILLQYIFQQYLQETAIEKIVVVLDSVFTKNKRNYVLKNLKHYLKTYQKSFYIYFHGTSTDINCQIADYCGWALYVKNERDEVRPYEEIKNQIGSTIYYPHKTDHPAYPFREESEDSY